MASLPIGGRVDAPAPPPPSAAYKRMVWLALASLALFVAFYLALCGWFFYNAYSLIKYGDGISGFWQFAFIFASICWGAFMLKALFFIQRGSVVKGIEITRQQEPRLFEFLEDIADQAKAPRPRRVYLSDRVNAAVSYDLSLLNVMFPSKKNLEIGLGLVNVLNLSEFRAVLAHEFGHFAQRAMAVGRWVYVVHQVAAQIVSRRDRIDAFLNSLSRSDPRVAWVGWIFQTVIWALRSLVDTGFRGVYYVQRALGREMEFQADLVSVALCGSDALIHALYRLQAADHAWDLSVDFAKREAARSKPPQDLYQIQARLMANLGRMLNDPSYLGAPELPQANRAAHRVFRPEIGLPPKMWSTHPSNFDREVNAKRSYIYTPNDVLSAWSLFQGQTEWRAQSTLSVLGLKAPSDTPPVETIAALDSEFDKVRFRSIYNGTYVNRSAVLHHTEVDELWIPGMAADEAALARLYPASLGADMVRLRDLDSELASLLAIERGVLRASGRSIQFRGNAISSKHLAATIRSVREEAAELRASFASHDRACRSSHLAAARQIGGGWDKYLLGKLGVAHLAAHTEAVIRSAHRDLLVVLRQETASGRPVKAKGVEKILRSAGALYDTLAPAHALRAVVELDYEIQTALACASLAEFLGAFSLPRPTRSSLAQWLGVIDGWVAHLAGKYASLEACAFDQLLLAEQQVATLFRAGDNGSTAPTPSVIPDQYQTRPPDQDAATKKPGFLARLRDKNGWFLLSIRFVVAAGVFAALAIGARGLLDRSTIDIYNGLGIPVKVQVGDHLVIVQGHSHAGAVATAGTEPRIVSQDFSNHEIESFEPGRILIGHRYIYNIAGAAPLAYLTAVYGNAAKEAPVLLGLKRWSTTDATVVFEPPPTQIQTKGGGGTVHFVAALETNAMYQWVGALSDATERNQLIDTHLRWDPAADRDLGFWLGAVSQLNPNSAALEGRLKQNPDDVLTHLMQIDQSTGTARETQCKNYNARADANQNDAASAYLATRCLEGTDRQHAVEQGRLRFPRDAWFAMSSGRIAAQQQNWNLALREMEQARLGLPALSEMLATLEARIYRYQPAFDGGRLQALTAKYPQLRLQQTLESPSAAGAEPSILAYQALSAGRLDGAMKLVKDLPQQDGARLMRLIAASNGGAMIVSSAQHVPTGQEGIDGDTFWIALGTALRDKKEPGFAFEKPRDATPVEWIVMQQFYSALKRGVPAQEADKLLVNISPEMLGQAYCMGTVTLGTSAPAKWRNGARSLLFASERPYI